MKIPIVLLCAAFAIPCARAERLSDADREALLDNLEKLREAASSKTDGKYKIALAAYKNAMNSDEQALELYLNCFDKVNFTDQQKKAQDFREWKRNEAENLTDPAFKRALRIQLSWLVLTLQAAAEKPDILKINHEASELVDSVFSQADKVASQEKLLSQSVTSSVFARAYEINHVKIENWPLSPGDLDGIFKNLIFPPLKKSSQLSGLRAEWTKRIQFEGQKRQYWGEEKPPKGRPVTPNTVAYEKFVAEVQPKMQWDMEIDLYQSGDESGAAVRMLAHIEKYINHPSAREWGEQLKSILSPKSAAGTTPDPAP